MKLLRTIRLDPSDSFVFDLAAAAGEWAVPGSFLFWDRDPTTFVGKERTAFRAGFLGIVSFGFSTLAVVHEVTEAEREAAVQLLAEQFVARLGAPDVATALPAAREEIAFAESLCDHAPQTLVALHRTLEDGAIREQFRTLKPGKPVNAVRAFSFVDVDEGSVEERIDLSALIPERRA
jgi:hypothetical protein